MVNDTMCYYCLFLQEINATLESITSYSIELRHLLEKVTKKQLEILKIFCSGDLLAWLNKNMKGIHIFAISV